MVGHGGDAADLAAVEQPGQPLPHLVAGDAEPLAPSTS